MKKLLLAIGILLASNSLAFGKSSAPDFRYPETVMKEATKQIDKASRQGNKQSLIDGLIRFSLAKSQISADYMPELISHIDSLATATADPCTKALMLGVESDMVMDTYNHDRYKYDNRTKADTVRSADPREWSGDDYRDRLIELSVAMLADKEALLATPTASYKGIVSMPKVCPEFIPTLYDMLAHHCISQLGDVNTKCTKRMEGIFSALQASHDTASPEYIYTELQRIATGNGSDSQKTLQLKEMAQKYADSPYSVEIIDRLIDLSNSDDVVAMARNAVEKFGNYPRINALRNFLERIDQQRVSIFYNDKAQSGETVKVTVNGANISQLTLTAYDADTFDKKSDKNKAVKEATFDITDSKTVEFPALPLGRYVIVPSFVDSRTKKVVKPDYYNSGVLTVTDLDIMMATQINGDYMLIVVDAATSRPIEGAQVTVKSDRNEKNLIATLTTNADGEALLSGIKANGYLTFQAAYGNDHSAEFSTWLYRQGSSDSKRITGKVFTDRGVYRPGETVSYAVVAYYTGLRLLEVAQKKHLTVDLCNAVGKRIASDTLVTDEFGRANGSLKVPTDGLTGSFHLRVKSDDGYVCSTDVEVSEYKAPTFYLEIDKEKSELADLKSVQIAGRAMTYSQFPLADTKVKVAVEKRFSWWWDDMDFTSYETEVTTDKEGNFLIDVPSVCFSSAKGQITVNATVSATDSRGETQTVTEALRLGKLASLPTLSDITANADRPIELSNDLMNFDLLSYTISADSAVVTTGTLTPATATIDASGLASGKYTVKVGLPDGSDSKVFTLRLYRLTDERPAFDVQMLVDNSEEVQCREDGSYDIDWGNSRESWFFYVATCDGSVTDYGWEHAEAGMHKFTGTAKFSPRTESRIQLFWMEGHEIHEKSLQLKPFTPQDSIEIITSTFRDNITPGSKETWTLRIRNNNGKHYRTAVIANMYDAALNAIRGNEYQFSPVYRTSGSFWHNSSYAGRCSESVASEMTSYDVPAFIAPWLNYYGHSFAESMRGNLCFATRMGHPMMLSAKMTANSMDGMAMAENAVEEVAAVAGTTEAKPAETAADSQAQLRNEGVKTAFFLPGLVSNDNGEVTFTFDVPDRNTQWQFSAVAYTDDMHADYINRIVSASKPLMVQPNVPRFVREGDRLQLQAAVMNNTDLRQTVDVVVTVNGMKQSFAGIVLEPRGSKTVTAVYDVQASATELTITTVASQKGATVDGQRDRIAVLSATTDVVEAAPFYLTSAQGSAQIALPSFNRDGRLTLEYADNPAWYAASALPSMQQSASTASALAANYYVITVASRIVADNPDIAAAIADWQKSGALKSELQKNADLKITQLDCTPWSRRADTETDMMQHLADLTDAATIQYRQQQALAKLSDLQCSDGGFRWFDGCQSSRWTTMEVLRLMGYLREMGYYPTADAIASKMVKRAVSYCDTYFSDMSRREGVTREMVIASAGEYVTVRSMLDADEPQDEMVWIAEGVVDAAARHWGDRSVLGKAKAAMLLANEGRTTEAKNVVESLRQYLRKSADHGWYWDVDGADKVAMAATALKAFHKLNPKDAAIDGIRQWLLLSKQTQCWGSTVKACDAINALLATGKSWTKTQRKAPVIKVGNARIDTSSATPYFGYLRRTVTVPKGATLSISRAKGCPAWGAVYCQYSAPMDSVESHANAEIRIEKQFYVYDSHNALRPAATTEFTTGDRIQVRLTIRSERDLDYVALTDDRGACFEPVDQTSHYEWQDGTGSYRETRDAATNVFFTHMRKGTYVVTYDVYANNAGTYTSGIAALQCQYAPSLTAHSRGTQLTVKR